ncbi:MAG: hypothetical protein FJX72_09790, partial [Armatimonadetes bacterium]|nr:hypothetical protein [Armatimonadota bacterium]
MTRSDVLEFDFVAAPGADLRRIRMAIRGADRIRQEPDGSIVAVTAAGDVRLHRPVAYQEIGGKRTGVECSYVPASRSAGRATLALRVGAYDRTRPIVIDPILEYSALVGGSGYDDAYAVAVDGDGCAYLTGATTSTDYPTTPGALDRTGSSAGQVFVTKFDQAGSALIYSTYVGSGSADDFANGIAVDATGAVYLVGQSKGGIPTTSGAFAPTPRGARDGFVVKLNPTGSSVVWGTYLGGSTDDAANAIALGGAGACYVVGQTLSTNFPTTAGAFQTAPVGQWDAFATKLDPSGASLQYSTYLGGEAADYAYGVGLDILGYAYITGSTGSVLYPVTTGVFQTDNAGGFDAFVTKLDPSGASLAYSTFVGGYGDDHGYGIAVDPGGAAYIGGPTNSAAFPATPGALRTTCAGGMADSFVAKLDSAGSALAYATYVGGPLGSFEEQVIWGIAVAASGEACVVGATESTAFPTTPGAFRSALAGQSDAFFGVLDPSGSALSYATYLGGTGLDTAYAVTLDAEGSAYAVGVTTSAGFPTTPGA